MNPAPPRSMRDAYIASLADAVSLRIQMVVLRHEGGDDRSEHVLMRDQATGTLFRGTIEWEPFIPPEPEATA